MTKISCQQIYFKLTWRVHKSKNKTWKTKKPDISVCILVACIMYLYWFEPVFLYIWDLEFTREPGFFLWNTPSVYYWHLEFSLEPGVSCYETLQVWIFKNEGGGRGGGCKLYNLLWCVSQLPTLSANFCAIICTRGRFFRFPLAPIITSRHVPGTVNKNLKNANFHDFYIKVAQANFNLKLPLR